MKEIKGQIPSSVVILVGTKLDMRNMPEVVDDLAQKDQFPVSAEQGEQLKEVIGAVCYIECSSHTEDGIATLLEHTAKKVCEVKTSKKRHHCAIMWLQKALQHKAFEMDKRASIYTYKVVFFLHIFAH